MSMLKLAFQNFKSSFKNYSALIFSLAFTILIFLNFQYIIYSDAFQVLGQQNKEYIDTIVNVISFVLGCFMFFFLWYSTNVFLTKRKKEIGIYVFMGLTNQKIGKLYMIECTMTGIAAMVFGVVGGVLVSQLFQMILLAISDIAIEIKFHFAWQPVVITIAIYLLMYLIFVIKGYVEIIKSSVLEMVSANRQNEYVKQKGWVLLIKVVLGVIALGAGFYLAIKDGGPEIMGNALAAVVLVVIGVYFLFGGFIPLVFQSLGKRKGFLYKHQRTLWVNNMIFRMKKNYRTYAMTCVLMLCAVTALAAGFAMKIRYENMVNFRNTYTFQLLSNQKDLNEQATESIEKDNDITYQSETSVLYLDQSLVKAPYTEGEYAALPYSQMKRLAEDADLSFDYPELASDETINLTNMPLISLMTGEEGATVGINGQQYREIDVSRVPYLGYLQESINYYVVNDEVYQSLLPLGQELYTYNYRIADIYNFSASLDELDSLVSNEVGNYTARIAIDPNDKEMEFIKILYSLCIFMFMVFILASGCILYMKLYNDAFEEKQRYAVLKKLGFDQRTLRKSIGRELLSSYALPFIVMAVASYFSVHALGKIMMTNLILVNIVSVAVIFVFFAICYVLSISVYQKNIGLNSK